MERNCVFKCALSLTDRERKLKKTTSGINFQFSF